MIRPATPADLAAVARIVRDAYTPYIVRIGKEPGPMRDDYAAQIAAGTVSVAEVDGPADKNIGGLIVLIDEPDHLLLDNIAVAPALQGHGVGGALMRFADDEARRRGFAELRLYTHVLMTENIARYKRLGWRETHRATQNGYERMFMTKSL
jgi:GNAT superfamily N-acetyltransferase